MSSHSYYHCIPPFLSAYKYLYHIGFMSSSILMLNDVF